MSNHEQSDHYPSFKSGEGNVPPSSELIDHVDHNLSRQITKDIIRANRMLHEHDHPKDAYGVGRLDLPQIQPSMTLEEKQELLQRQHAIIMNAIGSVELSTIGAYHPRSESSSDYHFPSQSGRWVSEKGEVIQTTLSEINSRLAIAEDVHLDNNEEPIGNNVLLLVGDLPINFYLEKVPQVHSLAS